MRFEKKPDWLDIVSAAAVGVAAAAVVAGVVYISKKCRDYIECADLFDDGCDDDGWEEEDCCCDTCACEEADEECACDCEEAPSIEEVVKAECAPDAEEEE